MRKESDEKSRVDPIEIAYHGGINGLFESVLGFDSPSTGGRLIPVRISARVQGPDDFNGCGYFQVRLYADTVEGYVLTGSLLHFFVCLKRTLDQMLSSVLMSGQLHLAIVGFSCRSRS